MSLDLKDTACVRCHAYLFSEDDVVYCPICGAPHHRDCYNALGHCALEELHGTDKEYSKEKEAEKRLEVQQKEYDSKAEDDNKSQLTLCSVCGEKYDLSLNNCPKCKAPNLEKMGYRAFDFLGGIPADTVIENDVTAEDVKKFVGANSYRYVPKFLGFAKGKKASWNWLGFFFPSGWFLSRKMYTNGIIAAVLDVISKLLSIPLISLFGEEFYTNPYDINALYEQLEVIVKENGNNFVFAIMMIAFLGSAITVALRVLTGIFGEFLYKKHTIRTISGIKANSEDIDSDFRKKGGVSLILFLLGILITNNLPNIIFALISA